LKLFKLAFGEDEHSMFKSLAELTEGGTVSWIVKVATLPGDLLPQESVAKKVTVAELSQPLLSACPTGQLLL
jgi:hypothetical protein